MFELEVADRASANDDPDLDHPDMTSIIPRKRLFPGPAGILPKIDDKQLKSVNQPNHPASQMVSQIISEDVARARSRKEAVRVKTPVLTQAEKNRELLNRRELQDLLEYLREDPESAKVLAEAKNINWIRTKAAKLQVCITIPFLVVVLQDEVQFCTRKKGARKMSKATVIDQSGTIHANLEDRLVRNYGNHLLPGTALALKNAGFFVNRRKILITIAQDNVIYLASKVCDNTRIPECRGNVNIFKVCNDDFSFDSLLQHYKNLTDVKLCSEQLEIFKQDSQDDFDSDFNASCSKSSFSSLLVNSSTFNTNTPSSIRSPHPFSIVSTEAQKQEVDTDSEFNFEDDEDGDELFKNFDLDSVAMSFDPAVINNRPQGTTSTQVPHSSLESTNSDFTRETEVIVKREEINTVVLNHEDYGQEMLDFNMQDDDSDQDLDFDLLEEAEQKYISQTNAGKENRPNNLDSTNDLANDQDFFTSFATQLGRL